MYIDHYGRLVSSYELYHYGIMGMHWGVRRYQPYPGDYHGDGKYTGRTNRQVKRTQRMAKKDAKRYANAKMYYGEGAGTRRKLLKAELDKKRKDPVYKEAFDRYVENADYASSAKRAKKERKTRDAAAGAKHVAKKYVIPGIGTASSIYYTTHKEQVDKFVSSKIEEAATRVRYSKNYARRDQVDKFLKRMGL